MRGCFVTGTDTGVGKTVVAAALVAALRASGVEAAPLKPVVTGLDDPPDPDWPPDRRLLAAAAGMSEPEVGLVGYGPPVSPHLAAELEGRPIDVEALLAGVETAAQQTDVLVVEGVGGLMVPLTPAYDVRALARDIGLPLVIVARPGLGTINHTLLTLAAARSADLEILGVVITPWPPEPGVIQHSNRATIERLGAVTVSTLPPIDRADPRLLANAGAQLPLDRWFA